MSRILIDGTALETGMKGVGKYALHVITELDQRLPAAYELVVLVFDRELPAMTLSPRVTLVRTPVCADPVKGLWVVPRLLARTQATLLFSPMEALAAFVKVPRIAVCHDINELIWQAQHRSRWSLRALYDSALQRLRIHGLRACRFLVCNSEFVSNAITERYRIAAGATVIGYCGVDEVFRQPLQYGVQSQAGSGYLLAFATGDVRENPDLLPAALALVKQQVAAATLVIGGVREHAAYVTALRQAFIARGLREHHDFRFVGFLGHDRQHELAALYRNAALYLELSSHEGFGMQLAEALASGISCLSTRGGALPEVGGDFADYLDELTPQHLADRIVARLRQPASPELLSRQQAFVARYDWHITGATIAALVQQCCSTEPV